MIEELGKFQSADPTETPNRLLIPITQLSFNDNDIKLANKILDYLHYMEKNGIMCRFKTTPSGGISYNKHERYGAMFDVRYTNACVDITVKDFPTARYYRFQIKNKQGKDKTVVSGRKAWTKLNEVFDEFNIDITKHAISKEEGLYQKSQIEKPLIGLTIPSFKDKIFENAHHIDRNSSYIAGICKAFPDLRPAYQKLYDERKKNPIYKAILVESQGFMQSALVDYKYSHIARAGIEDNNKWLMNMSRRIIKNGGIIIAYNTDGFWYIGNEYHDENEGKLLGQWKTDHKNCKLRFKSDGAYEFIENGVYHPVLRGYTTLDRVKSREEWQWGDIYQSETINYTFNKKKERFE